MDKLLKRETDRTHERPSSPSNDSGKDAFTDSVGVSHRETPGKENAPWGNVHSEMQRLKISKCLLQQLCLNILPILVYFSNPSSLYSFPIAAITNNHKFSRLTQHQLAQSLDQKARPSWLSWWSAPGFTGRNHHGSRAVFLSGVSTDELPQVVGKSSNSMWL